MVSDFADLLRRHRLEAGFSQEQLSEVAGLSAVAISGYERGLRAVPRRETVAALAFALNLNSEAKSAFEDAARAKRASAQISAAEHHLPWQATSFVGRQRELAEIAALVAPRRLVTVAGAGGIGKTRTALEIASRFATSAGDGIRFLDLAPLADGTLVVSKLAGLFDLDLPSKGDQLAHFVALMRTREALLLLDNCEHLISTIRTVATAMLQGCPGLSLLATSRQRLGIAGEIAYRLTPLSFPDTSVTTARESLQYDAVRLFVERAETAKHGFAFTNEHAAAATAICRRLDGIALAIELAAARLPALGLSEIYAQLNAHFRVIAGKQLDLPPRQQTLHAMISWSHDLLDDRERTLFRRISVFANSWTLTAVEEVCADASLDRESILDTLAILVEKSLVVADTETTPARYSFYESTRAYAHEQLIASAESAAFVGRHAEWIAAFADHAYDSHGTIPRRKWEAIIAPEFDEALSAVEWAMGPGNDPVVAARIVSGLRGFWQMAGLAAHGIAYAEALLERIDEREHAGLVARLLLVRVQFLHAGTPYAQAMTRAISLLERTTDRVTLARCYSSLAHAYSQMGRQAEAAEASDGAANLLHEIGMERSLIYASVLYGRSIRFLQQSRVGDARTALTEALALATELDDEWSVALFQMSLADVAFADGDAQLAAALCEAALGNARRVRNSQQEICALCNLGSFHLALGDLAAAEANAREGLQLARTSNAFVGQVAIQHLATVAALRGEAPRAAKLLGYMDAWCERIAYQRDPTDQKGYNVLLESLRAQLTDGELAMHSEAGANLSEADAFAEALRSEIFTTPA